MFVAITKPHDIRINAIIRDMIKCFSFCKCLCKVIKIFECLINKDPKAVWYLIMDNDIFLFYVKENFCFF